MEPKGLPIIESTKQPSDLEKETWPENKRTTWEKKKKELELAGFKNGEHGIEQNIMETVVALNLLGINTSESCEGHTNSGSNVPFVVCEPTMISDFYSGKNTTKDMVLIKKEYELLKSKLQKYLTEFNSLNLYEIDDPYLFTISDFYPEQSLILAPKGISPNQKYKEEYRSAILSEARKRMTALTVFLKEKYLIQ